MYNNNQRREAHGIQLKTSQKHQAESNVFLHLASSDAVPDAPWDANTCACYSIM